jgi:hypothetical protein
MKLNHALFCAAAVGSAVAQQYAGQNIANSLPKVTNGNVSFFNVFDATGGRTTLINYYSTPNGVRQDQTKVQRAIIILSGLNRDGWNYFNDLRTKIPAAAAINPQVSEQSVAIFAPILYASQSCFAHILTLALVPMSRMQTKHTPSSMELLYVRSSETNSMSLMFNFRKTTNALVWPCA